MTVGEELQAAYLVGGGAAATGAAEYLAYEAGVPMTPLPPRWKSTGTEL